MREKGATGVRVVIAPGANEEEKTVEGTLPGDGAASEIQVQAHGSATAFTGLADGSCDIGMASRKIKPDEIAKLSALGDMTSPASEHIVGLDGIAVIVNQANPLTSLTKDQLSKIFSGATTDWSAAGGGSGTIHLYARDDKSGTFDTFKSLVLGSANLASSARRFEDSSALSDAVANDANGIGFIGLPYVRSAKAIAVAETGAMPMLPNRFTVATEDYPLSRRLYLYTPGHAAEQIHAGVCAVCHLEGRSGYCGVQRFRGPERGGATRNRVRQCSGGVPAVDQWSRAAVGGFSLQDRACRPGQ